MLTATRRFTFDSSHVLPNHPGKCSRDHGHTYILEVTVAALDNESSHLLWRQQGFFVDFGRLRLTVKQLLDDKWDHYHLNNTVEAYPTAERLILEMWREISRGIPFGDDDPTYKLVKLKLHETPNNWIEYDGHDHVFSHVNTPPTEIAHAKKTSPSTRDSRPSATAGDEEVAMGDCHG